MKPGEHNRRPERRQPVVPEDLYAGFRWPWVRLTGDAYRALGSTEVRLQQKPGALLPADEST